MSDPTNDLPQATEHRLEELEKGLFTSDLLVNEFLLIKEVGFHPLGFVMGSSIYHTGIQTRKWGQSQELTKLTEAMYNARELAMTRMEEEAAELGADGVVGVRLDVNYYEWGKDAAEFVAASMASMPVPFEATIIATAPASAVRNLIRYANAKVETIDDSSCRVLIRSDSRPWLVTVVALLATEFDIVVEEPTDLLTDVKRLARRLRAVATRAAK